MEIRSILVAVGLGAPQAAVRYATHLAERCGAELLGIGVAEPPTLAYAGIDAAQAAVDYYAVERKNIEARLARAEEQFRAAVPPSVAQKWRGIVANPTETLIDQARRCDLVVVAGSDGASAQGEVIDIGHMVLSCGRPVIVVRDDVKRADLSRIVVAWKDTREARRAVSDALPLLRYAGHVKVVTLSEGDPGTEAGSLKDIVDWLARHGVQADSQLIEEGPEFLGAIGALAVTDGPDLIVSGGYGHSRVREWLFGGATNDLLDARGVNRLFSN